MTLLFSHCTFWSIHQQHREASRYQSSLSLLLSPTHLQSTPNPPPGFFTAMCIRQLVIIAKNKSVKLV